MRFLVSLFKAAPKGDNFRAPAVPTKYINQVAAINATGADQYVKIKDIASVVKNASPK